MTDPTPDLITGDLQIQVGSDLYGDGDPWWNDSPGWSGFVGQELRTSDESYDLADGDAVGVYTRPARVLTIPLLANADTVADAWDLAHAIEEAWDVTSDEVRLFYRLCDDEVIRYYDGRPLGAVVEHELIPHRLVRVLCTFKAAKPARTVYEAP